MVTTSRFSRRHRRSGGAVTAWSQFHHHRFQLCFSCECKNALLFVDVVIPFSQKSEIAIKKTHTYARIETLNFKTTLKMNYEDKDDDFSSLRDTRDSYRYDSDEMDALSTSSSSSDGGSSFFDDGAHIVERLQRGIEKFINNAQDAYTISCRPDYRLKVKTL